MRRLIFILLLFIAAGAAAQHVSVDVRDADVATVFARVVRGAGKNYVYPAGLLDGRKVTLRCMRQPLERVLARMFAGTDITFIIRGDNVLLMRKAPAPAVKKPKKRKKQSSVPVAAPDAPTELAEVVVFGSHTDSAAVASVHPGLRTLSAADVLSTPAIFGESDIVKTLQLQPGVSAGTEGFAGMHVHGGGDDENLFLLDNVPLYQAEHFAGLFSAFNSEAIRRADFYKSSFPVRYDGRLSSVTDVRTREGGTDGHHGSARLGLTSGALNIDGPLSRSGRTSYSAALRRSWLDIVSVPMMALANSSGDNSEKTMASYAFTDLNAKVTHRFSGRSRLSGSVYFSDDYLHGTSKSWDDTWYDRDKATLHWGNLIVSALWNIDITPTLSAEVTGAYTRFFSSMKRDWYTDTRSGGEVVKSVSDIIRADNTVDDAMARADFSWRPAAGHSVSFGGGYTFHSFLPSRTSRTVVTSGVTSAAIDSTGRIPAHEANLYAGYEGRPGRRIQISAGAHLSLFASEGKVRAALSPRAAVSWEPSGAWALKASYARATQFVSRLSQSFISLPTDRWVPVAGEFRAPSSDKVSAGVYFTPAGWTFSAEVYRKWLHDIVDYRDEYYLLPPGRPWHADLTAGRGTARGLDLYAAREAGRISGHIAYSLLWADRTLEARNGGRTYPARFDNRHKINIALCWHIDRRWTINAAWTGMSGNRFTLPTQVWEGPTTDGWSASVPLATDINAYRLPFCHRLDLGVSRRTARGYWTVSLYNAYCQLNTIAVTRDSTPAGRPVFKQLRLLPIIPSFSYTWIF